MSDRPLSESLRPKLLADVIGQDHLVGPDGYLTKMIDKGVFPSILLFGPPGCGKTTIARLYADAICAKGTGFEYITFNPAMHSVSDIKKVIGEREKSPLFRKKIILFVDEIHRINKAGQDTFLPHLESGSVILIGATTENPSFALNDALLSRLRVLSLNPHTSESLQVLIDRHEENLLAPEASQYIIDLSCGDARHLLNSLENIIPFYQGNPLDLEAIQGLIQKKPNLYDKKGEGHFNLISALHKSVRGSDIDGALYWLARMLEGGEEPRYIARRLIRMATEDIGLADPHALQIAIAASDAFERLGSPEGDLALYQATAYLALAPKSNRIYMAAKQAAVEAAKSGHLPPPKHILNSPTPLMKEMGYGKGYVYDHDAPNSYSGQNHFPEELSPAKYYSPTQYGFEATLQKRLEYLAKLKDQS
ncbi:MAG: Replication-associated recombination protein A [Chlamydiia bacterium]|nr:Replication-associated recombination protein A [Chlamydiia bacterium]